MLEHVAREGVGMLLAAGLEPEGVLVAFPERGSAEARGPFSGLNLSFSVGDDPRSVRRNRRSLASALGVRPERMVLCQQVHGATVRVAGPLEVGRGAADFESALPRTDGLVTRLEGVAIGVLTADCIPVVLAAPGRGAVAVAHAGWRGLLAGTATAALRKLEESAGCRAADVLAFIGPHIRPCCFHTAEEIAAGFERLFEGTVDRSGGRQAVDLGRACAEQLKAAGVGRLFVTDVCTACGDGYFSYRASGGNCGRQGGFAVLKGVEGG